MKPPSKEHARRLFLSTAQVENDNKVIKSYDYLNGVLLPSANAITIDYLKGVLPCYTYI